MSDDDAMAIVRLREETSPQTVSDVQTVARRIGLIRFVAERIVTDQSRQLLAVVESLLQERSTEQALEILKGMEPTPEVRGKLLHADYLEKHPDANDLDIAASAREYATEATQGAIVVDVMELTLNEVAAKFHSLDGEQFRNTYPKQESMWYLLTGKLELVSLGGYKVYGLRVGKTAITISTANALDYWFPSLRENVGREVIAGMRGFGTAIMLNRADASRLAGDGYPIRGDRVMNADRLMVLGVPPLKEASGQDREQYRAKLETEYVGFVQAIQTTRSLPDSGAANLADPTFLPKGDDH